jgi:hypothetical protein
MDKLCTDQEVSLQERRHRSDNFKAVYGAWSRVGNFSGSSLQQLETAGRYKPQAYCLRSGGLAA